MRHLILALILSVSLAASAAAQNAPQTLQAPDLEAQIADPDETMGVSESDTQAEPLAEVPAPPPAPEEPVGTEGYKNVANLQGLNKVTARISAIEAPLGHAVQFGNLEIVVQKCWQAPPTERPENAALMEIWDRKPNETPQSVFRGWMFSSSPSLAGLEHPVYDIIVLSCEQKDLPSDQ